MVHCNYQSTSTGYSRLTLEQLHRRNKYLPTSTYTIERSMRDGWGDHRLFLVRTVLEYSFLCGVCVCVCVCERERERERDESRQMARLSEKGGKRKNEFIGFFSNGSFLHL